MCSSALLELGRCAQKHRLDRQIQPTEAKNRAAARLSQVGCAERVISWREQRTNRYLITWPGCALQGERGISTLCAYRQVACDFAPLRVIWRRATKTAIFRATGWLSARRIISPPRHEGGLEKRDAAPADRVHALAMMCPFEPAEKRALLEAPHAMERVSTLVRCWEISTVGQGSNPD